jgi:hypothetical protein
MQPLDRLQALIIQTVPVAMKLICKTGEFPADALDGFPTAIKAQLNYQAALYNFSGRWARDLFEHGYSYIQGEWALDMESAIKMYLTEAWFEGMAANNLTQEDMTPEWQAILTGIIDSEYAQLPHLGAWIARTVYGIRGLDEVWGAIHARLDMWANRWTDVYGQARSATAEEGAKEEWVVGETEHCSTCLALNGLVAYVTEWDAGGFRPQNPPNPLLECGGYRCQCERRPTNKRRSPNVLIRLLDLATSQNLGKSVKGGEGSGNFGHAGRPGLVGGSAPGGGEGISSPLSYDDWARSKWGDNAKPRNYGYNDAAYQRYVEEFQPTIINNEPGDNNDYLRDDKTNVVNGVTRAERIKQLAKYAEKYEGEYGYIGIRIQESDYGVVVGQQINHTSSVWVDNEQTEQFVNGTSAISINNTGYITGYPGNVILILGSDRIEYGEDAGEIVMKNPVIIEIVHDV